MLRPASPRALWADIRAIWADRSRHNWIAGIFAIVFPALIFAGFYYNRPADGAMRPQVIYIESWPATRTDAEIKAKQDADLRLRREAEEERRRQFQRIDDSLNRLGI